MQQGRDSVNAKNKVNKIVTVSHIGVTLAFSITQTLPFFFKNSTSLARIDSAFFLFGGVADLFLSIMMWYIFDDKKEQTIFVDGDRVFSITDVIKENQSAINHDCDDDENEIDPYETRPEASSFTRVSQRMIDQFFTEVEGPDRDWSEDDYDVFDEEDRDQLIN